MSATANSSLPDRKLAYGVFRLTLGINILIHGVGRIFGPGTGSFAAKTANEFADTPLPQGLIHVFLMVLPFLETILGTFITLGLLTRWALTLGGLLINRSGLRNCSPQRLVNRRHSDDLCNHLLSAPRESNRRLLFP